MGDKWKDIAIVAVICPAVIALVLAVTGSITWLMAGQVLLGVYAFLGMGYAVMRLLRGDLFG